MRFSSRSRWETHRRSEAGGGGVPEQASGGDGVRGVRMRQHVIAGELAEEARGACLGMRVGRLHRIIARVYEQALQTAGLSLPQMEILTELASAPGPVRPAALAARLKVERSTVSRNLTVIQKRGWVTVVESSPTGRAMSVTINDTGAAAASILDQWLDLHPELPRGAGQ